MYKKRFAKWGFQKNFKRSAAAAPTLTTEHECREEASRKPDRPREPGFVPAFPGLDHHDGEMLTFLNSVQICGVAFFESVQFRDESQVSSQQRSPTDQPWPDKTQDMNFTFKLATDLLDRGYGKLAGRTARKAFLLVEDLLTLEGPVLVWNLLEIMHHMVMLRQMQLFQILLAHLLALVDGRIPKSHPIPTMLRGLRELVRSLTSVIPTPWSAVPTKKSSSPPSSSLLYRSTNDDGTMITARPWLQYRALSSLLERAWTLNAEIIFNHFHPSLLPIYCRIHLSACSIALPTAIISTANQWIGHIEAQQISATVEDFHTESLFEITTFEKDRMLKRLLTPRMDASPPRDYEMLHASSIAALWKHGDYLLTEGTGSTADTTILLRILAGLVTDKILELWPTVVKQPFTASNGTTNVSRVEAGKLACAIRTLMDLSPEHGGDGLGTPLNTVERIRSVVALREYAHTETDPQVVREMWLLEDALVAAGEYGEAQKVGQDAFCRLEKYIQDIPVNPT